MSLGHISTKRVPLTSLIPAEYNPRRISDKAKKGLSNSITQFGILQPIVWNQRTGHIIGGHQRYYDLLERGIADTDVLVVNFPIEKEKAANIALNHSGISGEYDEDKLQELLQDLDQQYIDALNFDELKLPEWETLPEAPVADFEEKPTTITISIPPSVKYIKDEFIEVISDLVKQHFPDKGIKVD